MSKKIHLYEIINHGVEHEQHFQGCGVSNTEFEAVFTGIGIDPHEALEDALNQAAESDYDVASIENTQSSETTVPENAEECWHYMSIRILGEK